MTAGFPVSITQQLDELLQRAIKCDSAKMGNIQIFDKKNEVLTIIAHKGFKEDFLRHFKTVKAFDSSACGRAIGIGSPVLISDVTQDLGFIPHRAVAKSAGFRAVRSVPLIKDSQYIGVVSTHYEIPQWKWDNGEITEISKEISDVLYEIIK